MLGTCYRPREATIAAALTAAALTATALLRDMIGRLRSWACGGPPQKVRNRGQQ